MLTSQWFGPLGAEFADSMLRTTAINSDKNTPMHMPLKELGPSAFEGKADMTPMGGHVGL
jgi:hypothetical protein